MKDKHIAIRIEQCLTLAKASNCPRRTFGALLVDPARNVVLMDGYNGGPRGGGRLCGGMLSPTRWTSIECGWRSAIAEMNVVNGRQRVPTGAGSREWACMMCAKLIHHSGIERVLIVEGGYMGANGVSYLEGHGVEVQRVQGPPDPRSR